MTRETVPTASENATGFSLPRHPEDSPFTPPADLRITGGVGSDSNRVTVGRSSVRTRRVGEAGAVAGAYPATSDSPMAATQRRVVGGACRV